MDRIDSDEASFRKLMEDHERMGVGGRFNFYEHQPQDPAEAAQNEHVIGHDHLQSMTKTESWQKLRATLKEAITKQGDATKVQAGKPRPNLEYECHVVGLEDDMPLLDLPAALIPSHRVPKGDEKSSIYRFTLAEYWQSRLLHLGFNKYRNEELTAVAPVLPQKLVVTNSKRHPQRAPKAFPGELIYSRVIDINGVQHTLELKVASIEDNLNHFSSWHNSDRVNAFWGERGTAEQHTAYLKKQLDDPHVIPVIGHIDGTAFGYFEIYWAKEDNIAPFADAQDYDRGFHALVGDTPYRGPYVVPHWIASLTHYCFLADPRTMRVMLEPRADNTKFINYLAGSGYCREKDFNFPHKRAALMTVSRENFFECHPPRF